MITTIVIEMKKHQFLDDHFTKNFDEIPKNSSKNDETRLRFFLK